MEQTPTVRGQESDDGASKTFQSLLMAAALWYLVTVVNKEAPARDQGENQDDEVRKLTVRGRSARDNMTQSMPGQVKLNCPVVADDVQLEVKYSTQ